MTTPSSPPPITIAITGATGTQGHAVISALASQNAALPTPRTLSIRALVRDPSSPKSQLLLKLSQKDTSVKLIPADFTSPESLRSALAPDASGRAVDSVFLNTSPTFDDPEEEVRHAAAVLDAARDAGVKHVVYTSVLALTPPTPTHLSGLPSWVSPSALHALSSPDLPPRHTSSSSPLIDLPPTISSRTFLRGYFGAKTEIEYRVKTWGHTWSILRPAWFMTNFLPASSGNYFPELGGAKPVLKSAIGRGKRMMLVDPADIGDVGARALLGKEEGGADLVGKVVDVGSEALGLEEIARVLGKAAGVEVGVEFVGEEEARRDVLGGNVQRDAQAWHAELMDCMEPGDLEGVIGRAPRGLAEFLRGCRGEEGVVRLRT